MITRLAIRCTASEAQRVRDDLLRRALESSRLSRMTPCLRSPAARPPSASSGAAASAPVGEDQVRDVAPQQRVLAREVHQLDRVGVVQHRLAPARDRAERADQVDLLERAGAEHLGVDLAGEREHRRAVDLRVPQAGEQVGGARAGDRQARGGRPVSLP
jgi:hypothetical protein